MNILDSNWSKFTKRIPVNALPQQVYDAWATASALQQWFLRKAFFIKDDKPKGADEPVAAGDTYEWYWYGYDDTVYEKNEIVAANGHDMLQFTFSGKCLVTVKAFEESGETIVALTQENIPEEHDPLKNLYVGCSEGWTFYLANLKSWLEGGLDLRNKNPAIKGVISS